MGHKPPILGSAVEHKLPTPWGSDLRLTPGGRSWIINPYLCSGGAQVLMGNKPPNLGSAVERKLPNPWGSDLRLTPGGLLADLKSVLVQRGSTGPHGEQAPQFLKVP